MGGRKDYSYTSVLGNSAGVSEGVKTIQTYLATGNIDQVSSMAIKVIASSDPGMQSLLFSLKLARIGYRVYSLTEDEYSRTGDYDNALAHAIIKVASRELTNSDRFLVEEGMKICWERLKAESGFKITHSEIDDFVVNVSTDVIISLVHGQSITYHDFANKIVSESFKMLFTATLESKEVKAVKLNLPYEDQRRLESNLHLLSDDVSISLLSMLVKQNDDLNSLPDEMVKSLISRVLNDAIAASNSDKH